MLTIERQDRAKVNILLAEPPTRVAEGIGLLRVYSMSDNKLLAEFKAGPGRAWRSHVVEGIDLLIGKPVQAKLVVGKQELVSPVLRP